MNRILKVLLALLLLAGLLAACGGDDDDAAADRTTTTKSDRPSGTTPADAPKRIVSLSPTATETLFAIGAGDQVVAVDKNSNYPEDAPDGELDAYNPNVEAIADLDPDLVVIADDSAGLTKSLGDLKIPVLLQAAPTKVSEVYMQINALGKETGHAREARKLAASMRQEIARLKQKAPKKPVTYYYELDDTYYSVTSNTFIGKLLGFAHLQNIADTAKADSDYPQLSSEFIVQQDPALIFLADTKCCHQDAKSVAARAGWAGLQAVKNGGVIELDDDIASRWGPRIVELLSAAVDAANAATPKEA